MQRGLPHTLTVIFASFILLSCSPAPLDYIDRPEVVQERHSLYDDLLSLLPPEDRKQKKAQEEARWLADVGFKAGAGISRVYDSSFPGWSGNYLVNMKWQQRGLCWHYQHDLFGELRRRELTYFRIGTCSRDRKTRREHNCTYIAAEAGVWPNAMVLDPWVYNGRTEVHRAWILDEDDWEDTPELAEELSIIYPEGHTFPIEFWYYIRNSEGIYVNFNAKNMRNTEQYKYMYDSMKKQLKLRKGKPTNY